MSKKCHLETRLTKLSRNLNRIRGGNPTYTMSEEEWDRRLNGCRLARLNVKLIDLLFFLLVKEKYHCREDWRKRRL